MRSPQGFSYAQTLLLAQSSINTSKQFSRGRRSFHTLRCVKYVKDDPFFCFGIGSPSSPDTSLLVYSLL
ncbi:hypothetical protein CSUI_001673 [Cystoisospora suis]|uniref:Uncharacterized protein n=1 Tax=Cystoisospora suis TaxID=483139 RepID=A0A2C6KKB5_9APIC|nr:hypothetical protein CSUI_001673 [Cystoisospora suis]